MKTLQQDGERPAMVEISVVAPVYQAAGFIEAFYREMSAAVSGITKSYEIIFVNDGSTDDSLEILKRVRQNDPNVIIIDLSRNFGQHQAIHRGLSHSKGAKIFVLDSDLEESPHWLVTFHEAMKIHAVDVVYGQQTNRTGPLHRRAEGRIFYFLLKYLADNRYQKDIVTARLMTRSFVDALLLFPESQFELSIIGHLAGFHSFTLPVKKSARGSSSYSLYARGAWCIRYLIRATTKPLIWVFSVGSVAPAIVLADFLFGGSGDRPLLTLTFCSIILLSLGIIAIYLRSILEEVRHRPKTIIQAVYDRSKE